MICPYCEQGEVLMARVSKNNKKIFVCAECDTVWTEVIDSKRGIGFDAFMKSEGCDANWNEIEILGYIKGI